MHISKKNTTFAVVIIDISVNTKNTNSMKRFIFTLFILCTALTMHAYEVGDWFIEEATGMPVIVVYVDQSGEHGLLMAPSGGYTQAKSIPKSIKSLQQYKKKNDAREQKRSRANAMKHGIDVTPMDEYIAQSNELFDAVVAWLPNIPLMSDSKIKELEEKKMLRNIASKMTGNGQHDQQVIIDYCEENGINMAYYFYAIDWCRQLGEGWFIPGNEELELVVSSFTPGIGKYQDLDQSQQTLFDFKWKTWMLQSVYPVFRVRSSTFTESPWEEIGNNKDKTAQDINELKYWNFQDNYYVLGWKGTFTKTCYVLIKNHQFSGFITAFKYF